jgi:high affinity sulfate transporter 1
LLKGFKIGVVAGLIALTVKQSSFNFKLEQCADTFVNFYQEVIAIGRTFAAMKDYQLDGNKEMVALGTMNVVASLTSCYITTGNYCFSLKQMTNGCIHSF